MRKPLNFSQEWIQPILTGRKRLTIRRAGSGYQPGDVVKAMRRNHPAFAELRIERVRSASLDMLTPRQARLDGHRDLESLRSALERLYPGEQEFDVISFRLA